MTYQGVIDTDFFEHRARVADACRDALEEIDKKLRFYEGKGVLKLWETQDASRLTLLRKETNKTLLELQGIIEANVTDTAESAYTTGYNWGAYVVGSTVGDIDMAFAGVNRHLLESSVGKKIAGLTISDRLTAGRLGLLWNERDAVAKAQLLGYGAQKTAREVIRADIEQGVKSAFSRAMMIARTETTRNATTAVNEANSEAEREYGIDTRLKWIAAHDERTRASHRRLDGTLAGHWSESDGMYVFSINGQKSLGPGRCATLKENVNCRCCTTTVCTGYAEFYPTYESYYRWLDRVGADPAQKALAERVRKTDAA